MRRLLVAAALAAAVATPAAADPVTVVCEDVHVRLLPIVYACLTYDLDGPAVTWECTLHGTVDCGLGST
ncbi:MAG TPA: hypothetical protein VGX28_15270 [Frankiaceae bacterium]|jgi:hypothetical protein|nr:hypothetical protein [Frankiaceae bacterium]